MPDDERDRRTAADSALQLISCVVVAFHRAERLARLLGSLAHPSVEVIVVNVEADPEVRRVAEGVSHLPLDVNTGYAAAVNHGVRHAQCEVVVFMNDDVEVSADAVLRLAGALSPQVDVAVPAVENDQARREATIAALPTPGRLLVEWALLPDVPIPWLRGVVPVEKWRSPVEPEKIDAAAAVVVCARRRLLTAAPLPEAYFLYWEESEWFWWLRHSGHQVLYDPRVVVHHFGGRADVRPEKSRLLARNAVRCVRRTQGRAKAAAALAVVILWNARLVVTALPRKRAVPARLAGLRSALSAWAELR